MAGYSINYPDPFRNNSSVRINNYYYNSPDSYNNGCCCNNIWGGYGNYGYDYGYGMNIFGFQSNIFDSYFSGLMLGDFVSSMFNLSHNNNA